MKQPQKPIKVYVPVEVAFDVSGQMLPRLIHWEDGKTYEVDRVLDIRSAPAARAGGQGDRYTIRMNGRRHTFSLNITPNSAALSWDAGLWNGGMNR